MRSGRLTGEAWFELIVGIGVCSLAGALVAGDGGGRALAFAVLATLSVAGYCRLVLGPAPARHAVTYATAVPAAEAKQQTDAVLRLEDQLGASESAVSGLRSQLLQSDAARHAHAELLEAVAQTALPLLARLENDAQLILEDPAAATDRRGAPSRLAQGLHGLSHLLSDILQLGQIEAGAVPPIPTPVNLRELMEEVSENGTRATTEFRESVPSLIVCDRPLLAQLLTGIIADARRAGREPRFLISAEVRTADLVALDIIVADGRQLAPDVAAALRAADPLRTAIPLLEDSGRSLGLAIALLASKRLAGKIEALDDGTGLKLSFLFPLAHERRRAGRSIDLVLVDLASSARAD